jgi:ATP-dependent DNA helicase RecG
MATVPEFISTPSTFHVILKNMNYGELTSTAEVSTEVSTEVTTEDSIEVKLISEKLNALLDFCKTARSRREMQNFCGIKTDEYFRKSIINPMLALGLIRMTIPNKPNSRNQKYIRA